MKPVSQHHQPRFIDLPEVTGNPALRWVGATMMDSEQYHTEGWHVVDRYTGSNGKELDVWRAEMPGLAAYGRLTVARRAEAKRRAMERGEEDEASWAGMEAR